MHCRLDHAPAGPAGWYDRGVGRVLCALLLATATSGCAQLFGFDETEPYQIRLTLVRKHAATTVTEEPMDLTTSTATFLVPDDAAPGGLVEIPAALSGTDTFLASLPGPGGMVLFTNPDDSIRRLWAYPAPEQRAAFTYLDRGLVPEPAPAMAQLDLNVTLDVAYTAEALWFYAVGPWAYRSFPELPVATATTWDPPPIPWANTAFAQVQNRPLERIRATDSLWIMRYAGAQLAGAKQITAFDQQDGVDTITDTLATVPLDRTLNAQFATTAPGPRFAATSPAVGSLGMSWGVIAAPAAEIGYGTGPQLHAGGLAEADPGALMVMYGNPFPWGEVVSFGASESRVYTPVAPLMPTTLYAGMYSYMAPTEGMVFDLPQGLPLLVSIDGRALTADGTTVTIDRTTAFEVGFTLDREDACDFYGLRFDELVDTGGGVLGRISRLQLNGLEPRWRVPNAELTTGATYVMQASCSLDGTPGLASGDLVTRTWPVHGSYFDSAVFTVAEMP